MKTIVRTAPFLGAHTGPEESIEAEELELPNGDARRRLVLGLANIVRRAGWERLVTHPILAPNPEYLPDPWNGSARAANRLARRLLVYAGMGERDVDVRVFRSTAEDTHVAADGSSYPEETETTNAAPPTGVHTPRVEIDVRTLIDRSASLPWLCREVARLFREVNKLAVTTREAEEELIDLTTVYLGFGLLTTNGSFLYRTRSAEGARIEVRVQRGTALGPGAMAYLLALQLVVRGADDDEIRRIMADLETTQADLCRRAISEVRGDRESLLHALELPPPETWPPRLDSAAFVGDLDAGGDDSYDDAPPREVDRRSDGESAFRVRRRFTNLGMVLGSVVGAGPAIFVRTGTEMALVCVFGAAAAGAAWGRRIVRYRCSECAKALERSERMCPRCRGLVRGTIAHESDRLAAAEAWRDGTYESLD